MRSIMKNKKTLRGVTVGIVSVMSLVSVSCADRLANAVRANDYDRVEELLRGGEDPNRLSYEGDVPVTPFLQAVIHDRVDTVKLLMKYGGKLSEWRTYRSARLFGDVQGDDYEVSRLLVESGADVNRVDRFGETPLHVLARSNRPDLLRLFTKSGAKLEVHDTLGNTPLCNAVVNNAPESAIVLVESGADVNVTCNTGESVEGECRSSSGRSTPLVLCTGCGQQSLVAYLLEKGADPNRADGHGKTALHHTAERNYGFLAELLLDRGAQPNVKDSQGKTPLAYAAVHKDARVASVLKGRGGR